MQQQQSSAKVKTFPVSMLPPLQCPTHRGLIMNATDDHKLVRRIADDDDVYRCKFHPDADDDVATEYNKWFRSELDVALGCHPVDFYVCPERTCNHAICANCMLWRSKKEKLVAKAISLRYVAERLGALAILGLVMVTLAQSMYLPAVRNAVAAVFCHSSLACEFPDCYSPPTPAYLVLALLSGLVLLFIGVGFVAFLFGFVAGRKVALVKSGILNPGDMHFWGQSPDPVVDEDGWPDGDTPEVAPKRAPASMLEVLTCDIAADKWQAILQRDESMFKGAYQQYEFRYMAVHGPLMVFKLLQLGVVLYAGEPNSLTQLAAAGLVEVAQLAVLVATNPFTDPWIDALSKAGAVHQVGQLGLMGLFRADVAEDPGRRGAAFAMIGLATAYFVLVVAVIVFVVVVPVATAWRRTKAREAAERAAAEQRFEDERKEIAGRDREEQVQREQEEKDDSADLEVDDDSDDDDDDDDGDANGDAAAHVDGDADDGSDDSDSW